MSDLVWRYMAGSQVKHVLYRATHGSSVCGLAWTPGRWQTDQEVMAGLRECRRCVDILDRPRGGQ